MGKTNGPRCGRTPSATSARRRARAGFSLIEVLVALSVASIALTAMAATIASSRMATTTAREATLAKEAVRRTLETIKSQDFPLVFALYNGTGDDDPGGAGTAPGQGFAVAGLDPREGDADGLPGEIVLPEGVLPGVLLENLNVPRLGLPRDLNRDGAIDGNDHSGDYRLLPVLVRVEWQSRGGRAKVELRTMLVTM
jgi:prepilin-type N-terminal cleavage/methylation domain-containing protein